MSGLAEKLRAFEHRIRLDRSDTPDLAEWLTGVADELSALAAYADGRLITGAACVPKLEFGLVVAYIPTIVAADRMPSDAYRRLQEYIDARDGRVLPE